MSQSTEFSPNISGKPKQKGFRKPFWAAILVIFIWFGASGVFGPLFGKLTSVQENDNSAFLPDSAESTKASKLIGKFSNADKTQLPALVLLEGTVDVARLALINQHLQTLPSKNIKYLSKYKGTFDTGIPLSKYLSATVPLTAFPAPDGKAILINLPVLYTGAGVTMDDGKPVPGVAPAAIQMADTACENILRDLKSEPRKDFKYWDKGSMATIGKNKAIVEAGRFKLTGFIAWLAWLFVHVISLIGFKNRLYVLSEWFWAYLTRERSARLITGDAEELENAMRFLEAKPKAESLPDKHKKESVK